MRTERRVFRIGDCVQSKYRSPWYGVIVYNSSPRWITVKNFTVVEEDKNYQEGGTHYLNPEGCLVKVLFDGRGNPIRKPFLVTIHDAWLRYVKDFGKSPWSSNPKEPK